MLDTLTITREWFSMLESLPTVESRWNVLYAVSRFAFDGLEPKKDELTAIEKCVFMTIHSVILGRNRNSKYYSKHKEKRMNQTYESDTENEDSDRLNQTYDSDDLQLFPETSNQHSITNISPSCIDKSIQCSPTGENSTARRVFKVPTLDEVRDYISGKGYSVDPEEFFSFYESQGWHVGKNKMRDWHRAVSYWQCRINNRNKTRAQLRDYSGI